MRTLAAAVASAALLGACTDPPARPGSGAAPDPGLVRADALDAAIGGERSLLAFLPPGVTGGTFRLAVDRHPARHRGVFWRTPSGNAYTRLEPYDAAFVARTVAPVVRRAEAQPVAREEGAKEPDPARVVPLRAGAPEPHAELQYPFEQVVYENALRAEHGNDLVRTYDEDCDAALTAHERAARAAVREVEPAFAPGRRGTEVWTLDVAALRARTAETRHATELACDTQRDADSPDDEGTVLTVTRSATTVTVEVEHPYLGGRYELTVRPGDPGPPPAPPRPADAFDRVNDFLAAVNACGALPWEWSNFMAGNDYTAPDEDDYRGPTVFTDEWYCPRDVPERERERDNP